MRPTNFPLCLACLLCLSFTQAKIGYFWHLTDLHYDPFHNSPDFHRGNLDTLMWRVWILPHQAKQAPIRSIPCASTQDWTALCQASGIWTPLCGGCGYCPTRLNKPLSAASHAPQLKTGQRSAKQVHRTTNDHSHRNGRHRDHTCDSSYSLIQSAAAFMAERHPDTLEFVLWTGDILSSTMEHLPEEMKLEAVRNVTDVLSRTFSSQFVFPALGHTDPPPSRRLVDMWMQWLPSDALATFETGGYYTIEQSHSKLRIVVLNSVLWSGQARDETHRTHKGRAQWEFLEKVLSEARRKNERVYLVAHAGPGVEERQNTGSGTAASGGELTHRANDRLLHVIRGFSDVIAGQFYGHRHIDSFRLVYSEGLPVSWAMLAPSLTPRGPGGVSNPGLRLYKFDSKTGKVLDYTQYYLDVSKPDSRWTVEYNLTQYYGLREVSSSALDSLASRMRSYHDRGVFAKYLSALHVRHAPDMSDCDVTCAHAHYCAITRSEYSEYHKCIHNPASALASRASHTSAAILLYAILMLITS